MDRTIFIAPRALRVLLALPFLLGALGVPVARAALREPAPADAPLGSLTAPPALERGDGVRLLGGSARVREVQRLFTVLGYPLGRERGTGVFGERTEGAVTFFQRKEGWPVTGRVGDGTLALLRLRADGLAKAARRSAPPPVPVADARPFLLEGLALGAAFLLALLALLPAPGRARSPLPRVPARTLRAAAGAVAGVAVVALTGAVGGVLAAVCLAVGLTATWHALGVRRMLRGPGAPAGDLPTFSVLVAADEAEIAAAAPLLAALRALDYPEDRLEGVLVTVAGARVDAGVVPSWMRVQRVPADAAGDWRGRALRDALSRARGFVTVVGPAARPAPGDLRAAVADSPVLISPHQFADRVTAPDAAVHVHLARLRQDGAGGSLAPIANGSST